MASEAFLVGAGGGLGSMSRYGIGLLAMELFPNLAFPLSTMVVNMLGCFFIGVLQAVLDPPIGDNAKYFALSVTGFLGGFTTYSSFGLQTFLILQNKQFGKAAINVLVHIICGIGLVWCGSALIKGIRGDPLDPDEPT